jgi:hypothetical protein
MYKKDRTIFINHKCSTGASVVYEKDDGTVLKSMVSTMAS